MTPTLPGPIGPAPPTAKSPPGTSPPKGAGTTDGTGFASAMAAARARTSARGDTNRPATQDPPGDAPPTSDAQPATTNEGTTPATAAFDLAHLLLGLLPGAGKTGAAATPGTTTGPQPDRTAGAGTDDQTGMREAYQALMALLLTGTQTTQAPPTAGAGATLTGAPGATTGGVSGIVAELVQLLQSAGSAAPGAGTAAGSGGGSGGAQAQAGAQGAVDELAQLLAGAQQASPTGDGIDLSTIVAELRKQAASQGGAGERTAALRAVEPRQPAAAASSPGQPGAARQPGTAGQTDGALGASLRALADAVSAVVERGGVSPGATAVAHDAAAAGAAGTPGPVAEVAKKPAAELQSQLVGSGQAPVAAHATAGPAVAGAEAPAPAHDPAAFVARVADVVRHAVLVGDREVRLVLNPPELGHLTVHIQDTAQGVRVMLQASTTDAHDLLQQHLPQLQSALQSRDLRLDRLQVGYTSASLSQGALDGGGAAFQGGNRGGSQDQGTPSWSPVAALNRVGSASSATIERATATRPPVRDGGVDLKA